MGQKKKRRKTGKWVRKRGGENVGEERKGEGGGGTLETRRIHSGERCLSTVVNPLQGLVSCQTS